MTREENGQNLEKTVIFLKTEKEIDENMQKYKYLDSPIWNLTLFVQDVVGYISGFVIRKIKACVTCPKCLSLLETDKVLSNLQRQKTYGNLIRASELVINVCKIGEKFFRFFSKTNSIYNKDIRNLIEILVLNSLRQIPSLLFEYFGDHFYEDELLDSHGIQLIKLILKHYFTIRIHHENFKGLELSTKSRVRSINTKTILFRNH